MSQNEEMTPSQNRVLDKIKANGGSGYCESTWCKECGEALAYSR